MLAEVWRLPPYRARLLKQRCVGDHAFGIPPCLSTKRREPMTVQEQPHDGPAALGALRRFARVRPALPVLLTVLMAALVFAGLVQVAGLDVVPAVTGFVAVTIAVLLREVSQSGRTA